MSIGLNTVGLKEVTMMEHIDRFHRRKASNMHSYILVYHI